MESIISTIIPYIAPSALPLVVVIIGCYYIYRKIGNDRVITKNERDDDSRKIHDELLKHSFEITALKGIVVEHKETLTDLREQIQILNTNIVKLTIIVEQMTSKLEK